MNPHCTVGVEAGEGVVRVVLYFTYLRPPVSSVELVLPSSASIARVVLPPISFLVNHVYV